MLRHLSEFRGTYIVYCDFICLIPGRYHPQPHPTTTRHTKKNTHTHIIFTSTAFTAVASHQNYPDNDGLGSGFLCICLAWSSNNLLNVMCLTYTKKQIPESTNNRKTRSICYFITTSTKKPLYSS